MKIRSPFSGEYLEWLSTIRRSYGLTEDDYIALKKKANGRCMVCKKKTSRLNIDHCHVTQRVRGLLCTGCNIGLGGFKDSVKTMLRAIQYLADASYVS
jgi:predicted transport protein